MASGQQQASTEALGLKAIKELNPAYSYATKLKEEPSPISSADET